MYAATTITDVADRMAERVRAMVYFEAVGNSRSLGRIR